MLSSVRSGVRKYIQKSVAGGCERLQNNLPSFPINHETIEIEKLLLGKGEGANGPDRHAFD